MRVTLKQIADRAGVSRPAVSAVLNNARGRMAVSEETRQHIKKIAAKMGYVPNLSAQMLSGKRSKVIGIVNMSFPGNVTEEFFSNLSCFFNGRDYHMLVDSDVGRNIINLKTADMRRKIEAMVSRNVEGLIIMNRIRPETAALLHKLKMPYVSLSMSIGCYENALEADFYIDKESGSEMAGTHLLSHGHRKILFVCSKLETNIEKFTGLQAACQKAGIPLENITTIEILKLGDDNAFELISNLVRSEGFTACLCSNDFIASRLMLLLHEDGLRVPDDLALIGYDGHLFASFSIPPLTTVIQPFHAIAEDACNLLLERIADPGSQPRGGNARVVAPKLFIGGSCGCSYTPPDLLKWSTEIHGLEERYPDRIIDNIS